MFRINPSLLLSLTVKSNIGAVICPASRRTSANCRQNLRFGHNYGSLVVSCASPTLSLRRCRCPLPPLDIHRSTIAFCRSLFPSAPYKGSSPAPDFAFHSTNSLCPTPRTIQGSSCHHYRPLRLSAYCAHRCFPPLPISYCKVTNFRTVPIFVLSTWNWFVRTIFVLSRVCEENDVEIQRLQSKKKFSYDIKFRTFSKVRNVRK